MNVSGFNEAAINSAVPDVTVRAAVLGYAYAMGNVGGRAWTRLIAAQVAAASAVVNTRSALRGAGAFVASANRSGLNRASQRSPISGQAIALTTHNTHTVLLRLNASALASAVATPRAARRGVIDGYVTALAVLTSHKAARNQANSTAEARATPASRVLLKQSMPSTATAQANPVIKGVIRSVVNEQAVAAGFVGSHTTIFYPFDEPALEESTFIVGFESNIFYVR